MRIASGILALGILIVGQGCRWQTATEMVDARLKSELPQNASRAQVQQYLQRVRVESFEQNRETLVARFRNVKNDAVCSIDVSVAFSFDQSGILVKSKAQEMRSCL